MRKAIILGTQRSGTSYLREWINQVPSVEFYTEVFLPKNKEYSSFKRYIMSSSIRYNIFNLFNIEKLPKVSDNPITNKIINNYLKKLFYAENFPKNSFKGQNIPRDTRNIDLIGFKSMYSQTKKNKPLLKYIIKNELKVIHIYRSNILDIIVSRELKKITGIPHSFNNEQVIKNKQVYIDCKTLLKKMGSIKKSVLFWDNIFDSDNYLKISFEGFLSDKEVRKSVLSFLNLPEQYYDQKIKMIKTNQQSLESSIKNYNEVYETLINTEFAYCLND